MNVSNNQLHQETERRMREALLRFLESGREPSVGQLCDAAQINRSTFYRHYRDIPDLMEQTEKEIQKGLFRMVGGEENFPDRLEGSADALEPLISYIGQNRNFYRAYLQNPGAIPLETGLQYFWDRKIRPLFLAHGVENEAHMRYYFEYVKTGFMSVLRLWIENGCSESPKELAGVLYQMLPRKSQ